MPVAARAPPVAAADALARSLAADDAWARSRDERRAAEARELVEVHLSRLPEATDSPQSCGKGRLQKPCE